MNSTDYNTSLKQLVDALADLSKVFYAVMDAEIYKGSLETFREWFAVTSLLRRADATISEFVRLYSDSRVDAMYSFEYGAQMQACLSEAYNLLLEPAGRQDERNRQYGEILEHTWEYHELALQWAKNLSSSSDSRNVDGITNFFNDLRAGRIEIVQEEGGNILKAIEGGLEELGKARSDDCSRRESEHMRPRWERRVCMDLRLMFIQAMHAKYFIGPTCFTTVREQEWKEQEEALIEGVIRCHNLSLNGTDGNKGAIIYHQGLRDSIVRRKDAAEACKSGRNNINSVLNELTPSDAATSV